MSNYLCIYLVEKLYGGPEEGGWWYATGTLISCRRLRSRSHVVRKHHAALKWCKKMNKIENRIPEDQVNSDGYYRAWVSDFKGANFPERRPHYE
jgi:hypothetical protein